MLLKLFSSCSLQQLPFIDLIGGGSVVISVFRACSCAMCFVCACIVVWGRYWLDIWACLCIVALAMHCSHWLVWFRFDTEHNLRVDVRFQFPAGFVRRTLCLIMLLLSILIPSVLLYIHSATPLSLTSYGEYNIVSLCGSLALR